MSSIKKKTIQQLFESQVKQSPNNIAVRFGNQKLTYKELNEKANQLAFYLKHLYLKQYGRELRPDTLIALFLDRGIEAIISIFAVIKAGGTYVPIDPNNPVKRIGFILQDINASLILSNGRVLPLIKTAMRELNSNIANCIRLVDLTNSKTIAIQKTFKTNNPSSVATANSLAYVFYTSGTTGTPKGVMIENGSLENFSHMLIRLGCFNNKTRCSQFANYAFDGSITEIFPTLLSGGALYIANVKQQLNLQLFVKFLYVNKITHCFLPTSILKAIADKLDNTFLQKIFTGGESLQGLNFLPKADLINGYGPTETCVFCTSTLIKDLEKIHIGKPFAHAQIYILDHNLQPVSKEQIGEIYIGGPGLARGYLNQPKLTAEKFISNPFISKSKRLKNTAKLFKTGDLARWLPDGNIEFICRKDRQVKVGGFRIELGEIEAILAKYPGISQAVVVIKQENLSESNYLVAYYIPKTKNHISVNKLITFCKQYLPHYMIPGQYVPLKQLPLTRNGKVDLAALPDITKSQKNLSTKASNSLQRKLIQIWQSVLPCPKINIHSDFFVSGGTSLAAIKIISLLESTFGVKLGIATLFKKKNIKNLYPIISALINRHNRNQNISRQLSSLNHHNKYFPFSYIQEKIWLHQISSQNNIIYNEPFSITFFENIDRLVLEKSLNFLIKRHEIFRQNLFRLNGSIRQTFTDSWDYNLPFIDVEKMPQVLRRKIALAHATKLAAKPFNLFREHPIRFLLIRLEKNLFKLFFVSHHLVMDGISLYEVFFPELEHVYRALLAKTEPALPTKRKNYYHFALQQRLEFENLKTKKTVLDYWKKTFTQSQILDLRQKCYAVTNDLEHCGRRICLSIPEKLTRQLKQLALKNKTTLFGVLFAGFNSLLYRYTLLTDLCVGTVIADQPALYTNSMGVFLNTLVIRSCFAPTTIFSKLLKVVRKSLVDAYTNQKVPLHILQEKHPELAALRLAHPKVYFVLEPPLAPLKSKWELSQLEVHNGSAKNDITFELEERDKCMIGRVEYKVAFFSEDFIAGMIKNFIQLLQEIVANPGIEVSKINLLSPAAFQEQIKHNQRSVCENNSAATTIQQGFERCVAQHPSHIAAHYEGKEITYFELNQKANYIALLLTTEYYKKTGKQLKPGVLIAICVERSIEMIIGILGILKAGAAYVPLDKNYPNERLQFMIEDASIEFILTQKQILTKQQFFSPEKLGVICLDDDRFAKFELIRNIPDPAPINTATDIAYVIYTSGTTGDPKGTLVTHENVLRLFTTTKSNFNFSNSDIWTVFHSYAFDFSVWEIWGALFFGGKLIIVPEYATTDPIKLLNLLDKQKVSVLNLTPNVFLRLSVADQNSSSRLNALRFVIFGGEALTKKHLEHWVKKYNYARPQLVNMYGITETTVHSSYYSITAKDMAEGHINIKIGTALKDLDFYVLDPNQKLVPEGVPGELYIGGAGVTRGYLNRPQLTKERFIENPFMPNSILYRSGDVVKKLEDGNYTYLGRNDQQIKINGFRIELMEIENCLRQYPDLSQCAVAASVNGVNDKIVAYYAKNTHGNAHSEKMLQEFLKRRLPGYMIPTKFIELDKLPLTINGKIDRKALTQFGVSERENLATFIAPRTKTEEKLACIWRETLGGSIRQIGVYDNFFQIGGTQSLAEKLVKNINSQFVVNLPVKWVHDNPMIMMQATLSNKPVFNDIMIFNSHGSTQPLIFIHPGVGGADVYSEFAKDLSKNIPFYCLDSFNLNAKRKMLVSIEQLASRYLKKLKNIQPHGPYYLGGWCLGGVIAYEIARQLKAQGDEVSSIFLIDSVAITAKSERQVNKELENYFLSDLVNNKNFVCFPKTRQNQLKKVAMLESDMLLNYAYPKYAGTVVLFAATEQPSYDGDNPKIKKLFNQLTLITHTKQDSGWHDLVQDLHVVCFDTDHQGIMLNSDSRLMIIAQIENWIVNNAHNKNLIVQNKNTVAQSTTKNKESVLIQILKEVFENQAVNKNDNFFALGGTSITAMDIVNRVNQKGYQVATRDIFQEQIVSKIAKKLTHKSAVLNNFDKNNLSHKAFPLSAVQNRFVQRNLYNGNIFSIPILIELQKNIDSQLVAQAVQKLIVKHQSLSLCFKYRSDTKSWSQEYKNAPLAKYYYQVDLKNIPIAEHDTYIKNYHLRLKTTCNIKTSPLFKFVLFNNYSSKKKQLALFFAHHLISDERSMLKLLRDFESFCTLPQSASQANESSSYYDWCVCLDEYKDNINPKYLNYWRQQLISGAQLFTDYNCAKTPIHADMATVKISLLDKHQISFLSQLTKRFKISSLPFFLGIFCQALLQERDQKGFLLNIMSAQRESVFSQLNISETVGFFAGAYPIYINLHHCKMLTKNVSARINKLLLQTPNNGIDYFVLKYLNPSQIRSGSDAQTLFHFSNEDVFSQEDSFFKSSSVQLDSTNCNNNQSAYLLNVTIKQAKSELTLTLYYSKLHYAEKTINNIAQAFKSILFDNIDQCPKTAGENI
ncbi:MAG: amino acid adenylation domain-containing protein [Gammaproteobacteria bacterium]|nr:amino acid adenylation domain-containing protein [Gammaproteobacteria bacterium]